MYRQLLKSIFLLSQLINAITTLNGPNGLGTCKARLDDGSLIDLSSLDDIKNPRFEFILEKHLPIKYEKTYLCLNV